MSNSLFEAVVARIREDAATGILPGYLQTARISPEMTLSELGVDSLGRMALLTTLMDLSDAPFSEDDFSPQQTLGDIVASAALDALARS